MSTTQELIQNAGPAPTMTMRSPICKTLKVMKLAPKVSFDPTNSDHVEIYRKFRQMGKWTSGSPFIHEYPFVTVPATIENKLIDHFLGLH